MKKYIKYLSYICAFAFMPLFGMKTPIKKQPNTRTYISSQDDIPKIITQAISRGNFVFFDSFVITHKGIGQAFGDAQYVQGNVGRHPASQGMLTELIRSGKPVKRFTDLHVKRVLVSEKDPILGSPGKTAVIDTSANLTYNMYHNLETLVVTEDDRDYFTQQFCDHQYVTGLFNKENRSPAKKRKRIIENTPRKRTVYNSRHVQLNGSKVPRIKKLLQSTNKNRALYVTSMNWLNQEVTNAIIAVHKDGVQTKVIVNGTALKSGKAQLDAMHKAGVPIYVFDPENKVRHAQHSKVLLRIDGNESLLISSTANMTPQGEREINIDCYHPQDMQAVVVMRKALDVYVAKKCVEYGKI